MGYEHLFGPDVRRSSENYQDVFIPDVLPEALSNVNQGLPAKAIDEAILKIKNIEGGNLEGERFHSVLLYHQNNGLPHQTEDSH